MGPSIHRGTNISQQLHNARRDNDNYTFILVSVEYRARSFLRYGKWWYWKLSRWSQRSIFSSSKKCLVSYWYFKWCEKNISITAASGNFIQHFFFSPANNHVDMIKILVKRKPIFEMGTSITLDTGCILTYPDISFREKAISNVTEDFHLKLKFSFLQYTVNCRQFYLCLLHHYVISLLKIIWVIRMSWRKMRAMVIR